MSGEKRGNSHALIEKNHKKPLAKHPKIRYGIGIHQAICLFVGQLPMDLVAH